MFRDIRTAENKDKIPGLKITWDYFYPMLLITENKLCYLPKISN